MRSRYIATFIACLGLAAAASPLRAAGHEWPSANQLAAQSAEVRATEAAFAATMAARDFAAFGRFIAPDAVFLEEPALRGAEAVKQGWKPLFDGPKAAFSWQPGTVEVLPGGGLAMSYGPVYDANGERISTFYSVWRRERDGHWRIVLDHGCPACRCKTPPAPPAPPVSPVN